MQMKCKARKYFSSFLMNLDQEQEQKGQQEEELGVELVCLGLGGCTRALCIGLYRGGSPLGRPIGGVGRPHHGANLRQTFSEMPNDYHTLQKCMNSCRGRLMQAQEWPRMNLDMKINQVHACTRLQIFVTAIFFQNCPLGTCLNPRFMRDTNSKGGESKYARVFVQKMQMLMQESNRN